MPTESAVPSQEFRTRNGVATSQASEDEARISDSRPHQTSISPRHMGVTSSQPDYQYQTRSGQMNPAFLSSAWVAYPSPFLGTQCYPQSSSSYPLPSLGSNIGCFKDSYGNTQQIYQSPVPAHHAQNPRPMGAEPMPRSSRWGTEHKELVGEIGLQQDSSTASGSPHSFFEENQSIGLDMPIMPKPLTEVGWVETEEDGSHGGDE